MFLSTKNSPEDFDDISNGPPSKRTKQNEEDEEGLGFLIVKGKDGQKQLFVDLGKVVAFSLLIIIIITIKDLGRLILI